MLNKSRVLKMYIHDMIIKKKTSVYDGEEREKGRARKGKQEWMHTGEHSDM